MRPAFSGLFDSALSGRVWQRRILQAPGVNTCRFGALIGLKPLGGVARMANLFL
jgi:hypothetical protein